jgi:antitoxin component YwqK of YwqJK toxin-antitoxin module
MRKYLLVNALIILALNTSAQVHKRFYNKNDNVTKDSTKAVSYSLFQRQPDSTWSYVKIDKRTNIPIERGSYLDEDLTIPEGKFVYYQTIIEQKRIDDHHSSIDTVFRAKQTGVFINGQKEGIWISYFTNGQKQFIRTFENNELNGLSEEYLDNGMLFSRSNYIKGLREGDSYIFRADSSVFSYSRFWHGSQIEFKNYNEDRMYNAYPDFNFEYYVFKYLRKSGIPPSRGHVIIGFIVTEDGKLSNLEVQMGVSPELDKAIIEAFNNSPAWVPAKFNKKIVKQKWSLAFEYDTTKEMTVL